MIALHLAETGEETGKEAQATAAHECPNDGQFVPDYFLCNEVFHIHVKAYHAPIFSSLSPHPQSFRGIAMPSELRWREIPKVT